MEAIEAFIRAYPWPAVLIAAAVGAVITSALGHIRKPE